VLFYVLINRFSVQLRSETEYTHTQRERETQTDSVELQYNVKWLKRSKAGD